MEGGGERVFVGGSQWKIELGSMDEGKVNVLYLPDGKAGEVQVRQTRSYNGRSRASVAR